MERILSFFRKTAFVVLTSFFTTNIAIADGYEYYHFNASGGCYLPPVVKKVKKHHHCKKPKKRCVKHYKCCIKPPVIVIYRNMCDPCASGCSYCVRDFSYKRGRNCATVEICIDGGDPYMY